MCIVPYRDNNHWAEFANHGAPDIWVSCANGHLTVTYCVFNPKTKKIILTRDVTLLQKSHRDYIKVEKPILVTTSYKESDDEEELEMVPVVDQNDNNNGVSNSESEIGKEKAEENVFDEDVDKKVEANPRPPSPPKWSLQ